MAEASFPVFPTAVAVPVLALTAFIIDIPPLAWHIRNRNLAASSLVGWVMLSNLMNFVNTLIWPTDDTANWWDGSGLCDVEVKLMIAITFGFVGALVCIMRNLAKVLDTKRTILNPSRAEHRREATIACLLCFGGPMYGIAVHYIVQPSRYYIFAISGCTTSYDNSWPKLVLILIWPPLLGVVVVYYSGKSDIPMKSGILLNPISTGHHTYAQIPTRFLGGSELVEFEHDQVSLLALVSPGHDTHSHNASHRVLCLIPEFRRSPYPLQLGLGTRPWMEPDISRTGRWGRPLRSMGTNCAWSRRVSFLRAWPRCTKAVPPRASQLGVWATVSPSTPRIIHECSARSLGNQPRRIFQQSCTPVFSPEAVCGIIVFLVSAVAFSKPIMEPYIDDF